MSARAKGYIPDPEGHRVTSFRRAKLLAFGAQALPDSVDHRPHCVPVLDQNACGSCVGHAVACACTDALTLSGAPLAFTASPRGCYLLARAVDRNDPSQPLIDEGSMPNQAVRAVQEWGVHAMKAPSPLGFNSDCDASNVNNEPTLWELEQDSVSLILGQYEIDSFGAQRVVDICAALANGYPVTCSVSAGNDTWQEWTPARGPLGSQSPVELDHYVRFVGYRTANGKRIFSIRNQWGTEWGDAGDIEVTEAFVAQIGDVYAFSVKVAS